MSGICRISGRNGRTNLYGGARARILTIGESWGWVLFYLLLSQKYLWKALLLLFKCNCKRQGGTYTQSERSGVTGVLNKWIARIKLLSKSKWNMWNWHVFKFLFSKQISSYDWFFQVYPEWPLNLLNFYQNLSEKWNMWNFFEFLFI